MVKYELDKLLRHIVIINMNRKLVFYRALHLYIIIL